jgi:two-component system response regulator YesN
MRKHIRIVLIEDERRILNYLEQVISGMSEDFQVIGKFYNGRDGLQGVETLKPDLVITDIKMPHLSGLDVIRLARENENRAEFVILSGYGDFEYARQALKYGTTEYLLKPIDEEQMKNVLVPLGEKIAEKCRQQTIEYLKQEINTGELMDINENILCGQNIHLIMAFAGAVTRRMYSELSDGNRFWKTADYGILQEIIQEHEADCYHFAGYHANEHIFALVSDRNSQIDVERIFHRIVTSFQTQDDYTNYFLSQRIEEGHGFREAIQNIYIYLRDFIPFGKGGAFVVPFHYTGKDLKGYPSKLYENIRALSASQTSGEVSQAVEQLVKYLEQVNPHQFLLRNYLTQITIELEKKFKNSREKIPEPDDLISSNRSFEEIGADIRNCCMSCLGEEQGTSRTKNGKDLVADVKEYLDENYKKSLSYMELYEKFGYSEKYLAALFKDQTGVSPSKYIVQKRIGKAKRMIEEYPDMMLKEIAQEVGYEDPLYFSRVFREVVSMSPKAYAHMVR